MSEPMPNNLGTYLDFRNGKTSPDRNGKARFPVYGSNGIIGYSEETNAPARTIVIGRVGTYCGSMHFSKSPCWVTDNAIICTAPKGEERYWFYSLLLADLNNYRAGSGQPLLNQGILKQIRQFVPGAPARVSIGETLEALDDKIQLNQRSNATLEEMSRALFKDWFVDFGPTRAKMDGRAPYLTPDLWALFPDRLDEETGLPEKWKIKTLGDVVEPRKGKSITKKTVVVGDIPVVAGGLNPAYFHDTANVTGPVITASASGANAGFIRLYYQDIWASDCSYINRNQTSYLFTVYTLLSCRQDDIYFMQQGAAQPHIYPSDLKRLIIVNPPSPVWAACESLMAYMFDMVAEREKENITLTQIRDRLLPKLMSGEIRLREAVKISGEVL